MIREIQGAARASTRPTPIVPLPPDDAWHQGGDAEPRGFVGPRGREKP